MAWREELTAARIRWNLLTFYQKFEHAVIMLLTALIAIIIALAVWNLVLKVVTSLVSTNFDPTDYPVFQALFGTILTVIIALEFKRSLLVVADRKHSIVQVRTVLLIALLAVVRKLMIVDLARLGNCLRSRRRFWRSAACIGLFAIRIAGNAPRNNKNCARSVAIDELADYHQK
jgi:uncharacterized membrane protein (DUF373 family)